MLIARSSPECHLYIELHPCSCGERQGPAAHRLESRGDDLVAVYEGPCPRCKTPRRFDLVLDPEIPPGAKFGGARPSRIIDAGEFLGVADEAAKAAPADSTGLSSAARQQAKARMSRAVDALEEVLKFIPPGADEVPVEALVSAAGKELYLKEPGRFRKVRLEAVLGAYRDVLGRL